MIKASIFDIDNTILKGKSSERIFVWYLWEKGVLGLRDFLSVLVVALKHFFTGKGPYLKKNKMYLKGKDINLIETLAENCFKERIEPFISRKALLEIETKREEGYVIILLSGTLDVLVKRFKDYCRADMAVGTILDRQEGRLTGHIVGIHPYGAGKAEVLKNIARKMDIDLGASSAYADHHTDTEFLEMVGTPVVVNAHCGLRRYAEKRGWRVMEF